jgi:hypothetical protein
MKNIFLLSALLLSTSALASTTLVLTDADSEKLCQRLGEGEGYSTRDRVFNIFCDHNNGKITATVFYDTDRTSPMTPITVGPQGSVVTAKITDIHEAKIMLDSVGEHFSVGPLTIYCRTLAHSQYADFCSVEAKF